MEVTQKKWYHSEKVRIKPVSTRKKLNGGSGQHAKKCYWGFRSPLRRINEERKKRAEEKKKSNDPCPVSPAPSVVGPSDQGFTKRKYVFRGYMSEDNDYVEVKPNPTTKEPKFKNKIEEMIWRSKNN